jgi:hypothetical protein
MVGAKMVGCPTQELVKRVTPIVMMQKWGVTTPCSDWSLEFEDKLAWVMYCCIQDKIDGLL